MLHILNGAHPRDPTKNESDTNCFKPTCEEADKNRTCGEYGYVDCRRPGFNSNNSVEMEQAIQVSGFYLVSGNWGHFFQAMSMHTGGIFQHIDWYSPLWLCLDFQGYLESEMVLNPNGKCLGTCPEYKRSTTTCANKFHCDLYRESHCDPIGSRCLEASKCPTKAKRVSEGNSLKDLGNSIKTTCSYFLKCISTSKEVTFCPGKNATGKIYDWVNISGVITQTSSLYDTNKTGKVP